MLKTLKIKLLYWLAKGLMPIVDENKMLFIDKYNKVFINNQQINPQEARNLQVEAEYLDKCGLWKLIVNYINEDVRRKVFEKSQTPIDMVIGKTILYTVNIQKKIIDKLKNVKLN